MADSQKGKIDMTTGHIMKNIILFAIPIIIGNVLQQLYTTVDVNTLASSVLSPAFLALFEGMANGRVLTEDILYPQG